MSERIMESYVFKLQYSPDACGSLQKIELDTGARLPGRENGYRGIAQSWWFFEFGAQPDDDGTSGILNSNWFARFSSSDEGNQESKMK